MYHILNATNKMKMDEAATLELALGRARELADQHKQVYHVYELSFCSEVEPTQETPSEPKIKE